MSAAMGRGYLNVTVANLGGRRKKWHTSQALVRECMSLRLGLVLYQEWDEGHLKLPVQCSLDTTGYLVTALNAKLGKVTRVALHEITGAGHPKKYSQTDILVSDVLLQPPRASLSRVRVINMHFHHLMASLTKKGNSERRTKIYDILAQEAKDAPEGTPTLIGGDFNSRWWEISTQLTERGLEVEPLALPEGGVDGRKPQDEEWTDCMALFFVGPRDRLPAKRKAIEFKRFDPEGVLLGHGAHRPVGCTLRSGQPIRSEEGEKRHKLRRLGRPSQTVLDEDE